MAESAGCSALNLMVVGSITCQTSRVGFVFAALMFMTVHSDQSPEPMTMHFNVRISPDCDGLSAASLSLFVEC